MNVKNFSEDPKGYVNDRIEALPELAKKLGPMQWRGINSCVTCDSHIDLGEEMGPYHEDGPAYFYPAMFEGYEDFEGDRLRALEGLSLLNLRAFGFDVYNGELKKINGRDVLVMPRIQEA